MMQSIQVLAVALILSMTGCNSVNQQEVTSTQHQVVISGFEFIPAEIEVQLGDTITWVNKDVVPHNVIDIESLQVVTPDLMQNEKFSYVVRRAMSYKCGFHPSMKGQVIVR